MCSKIWKSWTELETGRSISHPAVFPSVFSQSKEIYNLKLSAGKAFDDQEKLELFLILDPNWAGNPKLVVNESQSGRLKTVIFSTIASELILIIFIIFLL